MILPIKIRNLCKSYAGQQILSNFSADIAYQGASVFWGYSGVGKTTLLHILLGLIKPDSGTVCGIEEKKIAAVFQENRLLPWFTALENVSLVLPKADKNLAKEQLIILGLADALDKKVSELSGGMQRRVALARALATKPDILLLDEPFSGLDDKLHEEILNLLQDFCSTKAIILVSHDPNDIAFLQAKIYDLD